MTHHAQHPRRAQPGRLTLVLTLAAGLALLVGAGCNFGGSSAGPTPPSDGLTNFAQAIRAQDGDGEALPDYANSWDLDTDFSIASGGFGQLDGALMLTVGAVPFPTNQAYGELVYSGPALGSPDGITIADVYDGVISGFSVLAGNYSASMAPTRNSRIFQTLDLTNATPPIILDYDASVSMNATNFVAEDYFFRIVLKDASNSVLQTILYRGADGNVGLGGPYDLSAHAGRIVRLSFESRLSAGSHALLDDISVMDDDGIEYITNGDFEGGNGFGWSRNTPSFYRNVTTGVRTLSGLDVTRSFFTTPLSLWGRTVDMYTNTTGAQIDVTVGYVVDLASNGFGVIYDSPDTMSEAVTTWDSDRTFRDLGWVFGSATTATWTSDDGLSTGNGDDRIIVTYDLSVPAGQSVALVQFMILSTENTGAAAVDINAMATTVDDEAKRIHDGYGMDSEFTEGMTQAQIDAVTNL